MPRGDVSAIIAHFKKNNLDINRFDKFLLRFFGHPQSGWIEITPSDSINRTTTKGSFLYQLTTNKAALKTITLLPGETMHFFIEHINEVLGLDKQALWDAYNEFAKYPDGVIYPNTYKVPLEIGPRYLMIYNRLKAKMPLQMDGSLNYGKFSHSKVTPERIRKDKSVYNTYLNRGIPPYPVGSASLDAILATIRPASVDYLYFVRDRSTGKHTFSKTYKEHKSNF